MNEKKGPLERLYRRLPGAETCFYIQTNGMLTIETLDRLKWVLGGGELGMDDISLVSSLKEKVLEVGPKGAIIPPVCTNLARALRQAGIPVTDMRMSRRFKSDKGEIKIDALLEQIYPRPLTTFDSGSEPQVPFLIPVTTGGIDALRAFGREMALGWTDDDLSAMHTLCKEIDRDPTNLELVGIAQQTSEHCSHGFFNATMNFDGVLQDQTLFQMVKEPLSRLKVGRSRCAIAFSDNAAAIIPNKPVVTLYPCNPGRPSLYVYRSAKMCLTIKVESHNHPSMIKPNPGAATGVGGCIRDIFAVGCGGIPTGILVTLFAGRLNLKKYDAPGEKPHAKWGYSKRYASGIQQFTEGKDGAAHYGNASGIPTLMYHPDSVGLKVGGERREFIKPVLMAGLTGLMHKEHGLKGKQEPGMLVIALGGQAFKIGFNGGAGSSDPTGTATADQDQSSVQRQNPFEQRGVQEVIAGCIALRSKNPIIVVHDQGAGGMSVVGFEIGDTGVKYELRKVQVGDPSMSSVEIYACEYQERVFVLVRPGKLDLLKKICDRESVNLEVLGEITGNGRFVVTDSNDGSTPVDLPIAAVKAVSQKRVYHDKTVSRVLEPFSIPKVSLDEMVQRVLQLVSVGSAKHGLNTMDSWVGGKTVVNQRVGPLQLSVSQLAVTAVDYVGNSGHVVAQASQHLAMLVDEPKAARLTLATALGNLAFVEIEGGLAGVYGSVNWCWDAKQPGESIRMYSAMKSLKDACIAVKGATPNCGKDSLSLGVVIDKERVKSPGVCLITLNGVATDIRKVVTADIKCPGRSEIGWLALSGESRLGGSALAHAYDSVGDDCPDVDMILFAKAFAAMQELVAKSLILGGHNTTESGLMVSLLKMAMAGNCGIELNISFGIADLFAHEAGFVFEYKASCLGEINQVLRKHGLEQRHCFDIGRTTFEANPAQSRVRVEYYDSNKAFNCYRRFDQHTHTLCRWYEMTSDRIEEEQLPPEIARAQQLDELRFATPRWDILRDPATSPRGLHKNQPKVAIIRASGSNGHPEMAHMCLKAGMSPVDIHINDLMNGTCDLAEFKGIFLVGGFADGDAGGSAVGWAARLKFNDRANAALAAFMARPETFIHGVCNGCQVGILLGLISGPSLVEKNPGVCFDMVMDHNKSRRFEARPVLVRIEGSPAIMLRRMEGSILPAIAAHGEGYFRFASKKALQAIELAGLVAMRYCLPNGELAGGRYPWNPNGSPNDIAALSDETGRVLLAMPHIERFTRVETLPWMPPLYRGIEETPWLPAFVNLSVYARKSMK